MLSRRKSLASTKRRFKLEEVPEGITIKRRGKILSSGATLYNKDELNITLDTVDSSRTSFFDYKMSVRGTQKTSGRKAVYDTQSNTLSLKVTGDLTINNLVKKDRYYINFKTPSSHSYGTYKTMVAGFTAKNTYDPNTKGKTEEVSFTKFNQTIQSTQFFHEGDVVTLYMNSSDTHDPADIYIDSQLKSVTEVSNNLDGVAISYTFGAKNCSFQGVGIPYKEVYVDNSLGLKNPSDADSLFCKVITKGSASTNSQIYTFCSHQYRQSYANYSSVFMNPYKSLGMLTFDEETFQTYYYEQVEYYSSLATDSYARVMFHVYPGDTIRFVSKYDDQIKGISGSETSTITDPSTSGTSATIDYTLPSTFTTNTQYIKLRFYGYETYITEFKLTPPSSYGYYKTTSHRIYDNFAKAFENGAGIKVEGKPYCVDKTVAMRTYSYNWVTLASSFTKESMTSSSNGYKQYNYNITYYDSITQTTKTRCELWVRFEEGGTNMYVDSYLFDISTVRKLDTSVGGSINEYYIGDVRLTYTNTSAGQKYFSLP